MASIYNRTISSNRANDAEMIIADRPFTITRTRKTHVDKMRAAVTETAGPFIVRIEQFKASRVAVTFDEKGNSATAAYILLALNRPELGAEWTIPRDTFQVADLITDTDGNVYRVTSPSRWDTGVLELNVELLSA